MRVRTVATWAVLTPVLCAQQVLTLKEALERAATHAPSVRAARAEVQSAAAAIDLARTAWLPRTDFLGQVNRATRNNVFGLLLPQSVLPSISGPPNPVNDLTSVWGSAVGFTVSWEPFDFGQRQAEVNAAAARRGRAEAAGQRTQFEIAAATADAYLTLLAAGEAVKAAEAQALRARTVETLVASLVNAELRPGAELSRARADVARAEIGIATGVGAVAEARAALRQYTGLDATADSGAFLTMPEGSVPAIEVRDGAWTLEQTAAIRIAEAEQRVLEKAYLPEFRALASSYARGTGARPDGTTTQGGLGPNIHNWAIGLNVTFNPFDLPAVRARRRSAEHRTEAENARLDQIRIETEAAVSRAQARLDAARQIAALIPRQLEAAQAAEQQASARYKAGLGTLTDVAEAQRLLTQAEIDQALARLNVWRSYLAVAVAAGDLQPFLSRIP